MNSRRFAAPIALILACLLSIVGRVAESAAPPAALRASASPAAAKAPVGITLASVAGNVEVADAGTDAWKPGVEGAALKPEDQVRTGDDGFAMVAYSDATLRVMPASLAILGHTSIRLKQGSTWMRMRKSGGSFQIQTPSVAVSVCGTLVRVEAGKTGSTAQLIAGCVDVQASTKGKEQARLQPQHQAVAPNAGGLTVMKMDQPTLQRLQNDYAAVLRQLPAKPGTGGESEGDSNDGFGSGGGGSSGSGGPQTPQQREGGANRKPNKKDRSSTGTSTRSSLSNLQGMMDSRSTGLAAPAGGTAGAPSSGTQTAGSAPLPNSTSQSRTVQTQPGGAQTLANPVLLQPVVVPGAAPGSAGAAGAPPPR